MITFDELIATLIVALFFIYLILGLVAFANIKRKQGAFYISFPLWFTRSEMYNDIGKRLCVIGKILFVFILVVSIFGVLI